MGNENESTPVVMLDPADVQIVSAAQSSIRQSMAYIAQTLTEYLPKGATVVTILLGTRSGDSINGSIQIRDHWGDGHVCGAAQIKDIATDTILRTFDRACHDFTRQTEERDAENN